MIETLKKIFGIAPKVSFAELVSDGATIIDVRTKSEYASGHIQGSVNIPLDKLVSNLNKLKGKNKAIITCCASGARSASAKGILTSHGFTNVHNGGSWFSLDRKIG
ncbi:MAG TPA: rhodanese-like domain-containing protein [Paludibacter sp.]|nr:rhodanese-like domain-containing protein [Paludibacter sp.]